MEALEALFQNSALVIPIIVVLLTQGVKFIVFSVKEKKIDLYKLLTDGGLPSSHSALVSSLTTVIAIKAGLGSALFAITFIFALIVIHDASGVRRAAGEHAKVLNKIISRNENISEEEKEKRLVELLGHTKKEVYAGVLTGLLLTIILLYLI